SCSMQLANKSDNHVAFKVKTTNPGSVKNGEITRNRASC
ncbi:hypothetical protein D3Z30_13515, partial [Staphylococcus warneri]|nr:hypothetical protein [Staphylococcus warneri]